jgi:hypothetical protein
VTNLSRTFKEILRKWGHDVLLQRRLDDSYNYSSRFERVTTRHMYPANSDLVNILKESSEGNITDAVEYIYYFDSSVNPRTGDRIYENIQGHADPNSVYRIDYAVPMRGRFGKIEYWVAGATRETPV